MNDNEQVVIALYPSREAAEATIKALKEWDKANDDIKLGAIGTLAIERDEVKADLPHNLGRGVTVGAIVGIAVGFLTGPIGLVGGALAGGLGGGALGAFFNESSNLTEAELSALSDDLQHGKVALVVSLDEHEIAPTEAMLRIHGGEVRTYTVPTAAVATASEALRDGDN